MLTAEQHKVMSRQVKVDKEDLIECENTLCARSFKPKILFTEGKAVPAVPQTKNLPDLKDFHKSVTECSRCHNSSSKTNEEEKRHAHDHHCGEANLACCFLFGDYKQSVRQTYITNKFSRRI